MHLYKEIYCYETDQKFKSKKDAEEFIGVFINSSTINNPNKTAGGYHWCTDLSVFDNVELKGGNGKYVYCYETRQKFNSIIEAVKFLNGFGPADICRVLNNPKRTAFNYHWCDDLSVFDNIELTSGQYKILYCYETKEKFNSIKEAAVYYNLKNINGINNPNKTAAGYHFCTDLSIFDNIELKYKNKNVSLNEREIVEFLKENSVTNVITSDRKILGNKQELDIYLPDYNLAIEFNGDYWHSLEILSKKYGNPINYHQDKTLLARSKGIDLIQIFEFQYNTDKDLYLNYILDRINGIDRSDLELDENNNHILQFCNKKYFLEKQDISEPSLFEGARERFKLYDCGKLKLKSL